MKGLEPVAVAFAMFSRLPMPQVEWSRKNMGAALCWFPLVGAAQGGLLAAWGLVARHYAWGGLLVAAGLTLLPVAFNGGIHLDGLVDTADALASCAPREKRLEILADPHIGAFGAIALASHLLLALALYSALELRDSVLAALPLLFALSRAWSGYALLRFPRAKSKGLAVAFSQGGKGARAVLLAAAILLSGGLAVLLGPAGLLAAGAGAGVLAYYRRMSQEKFGGVSGDLAGWYLQTAELWMLGAIVAVQ